MRFVTSENWLITHVIRELCQNLYVKRDHDFHLVCFNLRGHESSKEKKSSSKSFQPPDNLGKKTLPGARYSIFWLSQSLSFQVWLDLDTINLDFFWGGGGEFFALKQMDSLPISKFNISERCPDVHVTWINLHCRRKLSNLINWEHC